MDRLIKLYLSSVFLVLIYSCSSIEIEEAAIMVADEKTIDKNQDFISEIAIGMGFGFRYDVNLLVLRIDLATPIRTPYKINNNNWVNNPLKEVLNGNLNILIKDLITNEDVFNLPFNIKDNQVIFLFMNIFDLNKILFFL